MTESGKFDFGTGSIAEAYERSLVPVLFDPWARALLDTFPDWHGRTVLDLGTGTGIVARLMAEQVGPEGHVIAADMSPEMLAQARVNCAPFRPVVEFVESPAAPLGVPDDSVEVVVCQQAFQFFPDKPAAAREIYRVLGRDGRVLVSTWRPVAECTYFGVICDALESVGEREIAHFMRLPFDFMPEGELSDCFTKAGFVGVAVDRQERPFVLSGGVVQAIELAWATPIGPKLRDLPDEKQHAFRDALGRKIESIAGGGSIGRMAANVLSAVKSAS